MLGGNLIVLGVLSSWLTPPWLLSVGVALGLAILAVIYGVLRLVSPARAAVAEFTVKEGLLLPLFYLALVLTAVAVLGAAVVPYRGLLAAVSRIPAVGAVEQTVTIPPTTVDHPIPLFFRPTELQAFDLQADQPLTVVTRVTRGAGQGGTVKLVANQPFHWARGGPMEKPFSDLVTDWRATNLSTEPATLRMSVLTDIEFPEVRVVPLSALVVLGLVAVYFGLRFGAPRVAAIALTTAKESMAQPFFYVCLALGIFALLVFIYVPYNTFGEDVKMLKDSGLTLIMVLSIVVAVWTASVSVADEIEGRTALTVLSKPIRRRQFILGKFFGIIGPVVVMFAVLGLLFLVTVSYKVVYDARESSQPEPVWQACFIEMIGIVPGLVLAFLETVVLASISVAVSTRLPMLANLIVCSSIYVLGHLVPMLVNSSVGKLEFVRFMGQLIATVLPVLDHFNVQAAVAGGKLVPLDYLGWALLYCVVYSSIAMLLALALFEDRDLA